MCTHKKCANTHICTNISPSNVQTPTFVQTFRPQKMPPPPTLKIVPPRRRADAPVCTRTFQDSLCLLLLLFLQFWDGFKLPSIWSIDEYNGLHNNLWDVCTFHVKIDPLHISRRDVCTLMVDVYIFLQICTNVGVCTFEGEMFAQMWVFAHFVVFCTFHGSTPLDHPWSTVMCMQCVPGIYRNKKCKQCKQLLCDRNMQRT